jgi:hypothetical protein
MNAAAGAAAATVGARLNGVPITTKVLGVAAVAGITKSAITTFNEIVGKVKVNFAFRITLLLLFSSFGICLVVTAEISNSAYGRGRWPCISTKTPHPYSLSSTKRASHCGCCRGGPIIR